MIKAGVPVKEGIRVITAQVRNTSALAVNAIKMLFRALLTPREDGDSLLNGTRWIPRKDRRGVRISTRGREEDQTKTVNMNKLVIMNPILNQF
jgi:hypothetical protein